MGRNDAKRFYDRAPGESTRSFISASDAKNAIDVIYDDMPTGGMPSTLVTAHGAVGDGVTDDTEAVEATILAAGEGGTVFFPPGHYLVSRTLWPLQQQNWVGTHSPKYWIGDEVESFCALVAAEDFTGRALIERTFGASGVRIESLCLAGRDEMDDAVILHGVHLGDMLGAERAWHLVSLTIQRFSGCGVTGRMHVMDFEGCHIVRNGYGIRTVDGTHRITDTRINACQLYFNVHGGICVDGTSRTGMLSIHGTRVERSGSTPTLPSVNRDPAAPGIRIRNAEKVDIVQVSTDANSDPGLDLTADPDNGLRVYGVTVAGCNFARDGGGDQSPGTQRPGVRLRKASHVMFTGNVVTWGEADDSGDGSGLISPYNSVWLEDSIFCDISHSWITAPESENSIYLAGDNYRTRIQATHIGFDALSPSSDAARPVGDLPTGTSYFSISSGMPKWWHAGRWVTADGLAEDAPRNFFDVTGSPDQRKAVRLMTRTPGVLAGDPATWQVRWVLGTQTNTEGGAFFLSRHDVTGAYVDDPVAISADTGRVLTNQMQVRTNDPSRPPLVVQHRPSPTSSFLAVQQDDGTPVFEVMYDGQTRAMWGSADFGRVRLGSTLIMREGATSAQTLLAAYPSTAAWDTDEPVFEVRGDGATKVGPATNGTDAIQKDQIMAIVAASTDFADFKSRIAAW